MAPLDQRPQFPTYLLPSSFSLPLCRRQSSTTSTASVSAEAVPSLSSSSTSSTSTTPSFSPPTNHYLSPSSLTAHASLRNTLEKLSQTKPKESESTLRRIAPNTLNCITCSTNIAFSSQIVSKGFTGRHGRAYLVAPAPSIYNATSKFKNVKITELINTKIGRSVNRELLTGAHVVADVSCNICCTVLGWKYVDAKEPAQKYKIGKYILEVKKVVLGIHWEDEGLEEVVDINGMPMREEREADGVVVFDSEDEDECEDLFAGVWDAETVAKQRGRRVAARKKESA